MSQKARTFFPLLALLLLADCGSKQLAVEELAHEYQSRDVVGEVLRFTLAYNTGASFSLSLGDYSRAGFSLIAMIVVVFLIDLYRKTAPHDRTLGAALGLIIGGALGNLADRLRSDRGVVDFIDIGLGDSRFYTFNLADLGITLGAMLLVFSILRRHRESVNVNG